MNSYEAVRATGAPQTETMYPGRGLDWSTKPMYPSRAPGPAAAFGAIMWTSSRSIPSQLREQFERGVTSSTPQMKITPPKTAAGIVAVARKQIAERKTASQPTTTAERRAAASRIAVAKQKAASLLLRSRLPLEMQQRIQRAEAEREKQRPVIAARKKAEAEAAAKKAPVAVHPTRPAAKAGIREWEAYYRATGTSLPASHRRKLERPEKMAFANATGSIWFIPRSFTQQSGVGVSPGVTWMFPAAYGTDSMPYWDLWFDKRATAINIGRKVTEDYRREIMRRVGIKTKYRTEREGWEDAGKPGPGPTIDPHEGIHSPIAPPKTYARARAPIAPPKTYVRAPRRAAIAPPEIRVRAPRRRAYLPLPTLGQIPGGFSFPTRRPWPTSRWLRFQAGHGGLTS